MKFEMNTREKMAAIEHWLGWMDESLSFGLKSIADAEKLYDYWQSNPDLPEMADEWEDDEGNDIAVHRVAAIGYDPLVY